MKNAYDEVGGLDSAEELDAEDAVVSQAVDRAVAPFVGRVTPDALAEMRAAIADMLVMHPSTGSLVRSLRERAPKQKSGDGIADDAAAAVSDAGGKKAAGSTQ